MATEEIHEEFYNFLMENERGWLMSRVRDGYERAIYQGKIFSSLVGRMSNTFSFKKKELAEHILSDERMADSFSAIAAEWVCDCAKKRRGAVRSCGRYPDLRDDASTELCMRIAEMPEWTWNTGAERSVCSYYVGCCSDMHPTNRQTFTSLVLTFIMQAPEFKRLSKRILEDGTVNSTDIRFPMF